MHLSCTGANRLIVKRSTSAGVPAASTYLPPIVTPRKRSPDVEAPRQGCPLPSHVVEGRSPEDPWIGRYKPSHDPARVSHYQASPLRDRQAGASRRGVKMPENPKIVR